MNAVTAADDAVRINLRRINSVNVDPDSRTATIGAVVKALQLIEAPAQVRLALLAGSSPNVRVVGYVLGGRLSPTLGRRYGSSATTRRVRCETFNVFLVLVLDLLGRSVVGHHLLDLNRLYWRGLSKCADPPRGGSPRRSPGPGSTDKVVTHVDLAIRQIHPRFLSMPMKVSSQVRCPRLRPVPKVGSSRCPHRDEQCDTGDRDADSALPHHHPARANGKSEKEVQAT
jgi:hypothetical protein